MLQTHQNNRETKSRFSLWNSIVILANFVRKTFWMKKLFGWKCLNIHFHCSKLWVKETAGGRWDDESSFCGSSFLFTSQRSANFGIAFLSFRACFLLETRVEVQVLIEFEYSNFYIISYMTYLLPYSLWNLGPLNFCTPFTRFFPFNFGMPFPPPQTIELNIGPR